MFDERSLRGAGEAQRRPTLRAFLPYAVVSLVPVILLGFALAQSYRTQARARGLARGVAEATIINQTAIEPVMDWHPLNRVAPAAEAVDLRRIVARAVRDRTILRLRLRNLKGWVILSDDNSGLKDKPEDEAVDAAHGHLVAKLTRLNNDTNDSGRAGVPAVEVYEQITAGQPRRPVGVLEVYLPYQPIERDIAVGMRVMYRDLALGLAALYLVLLLITASVTRGLRRASSRNAFLAGHDPLTQLPNRVLFHERAAQAVSLPRRRREPVVLAIIDLDRFKAVNDTLGHQSGDLLLQCLADRLAAHIRPGDTVARLGGDEFGLVLRNAQDPEVALGRLRALLEEEVMISDLPLSIEASIGYALAPQDGRQVAELLQRADVALYHAKGHHLGIARYAGSQNHYDARNLALVSELRRAIAEDQLVLHYQPKINLRDGTVSAVEALVRWNHPQEGLIYPDRFLPLVEQTDLIDDLTEWVVERALSDLGRLADPRIAMAVNISARNLTAPGFGAQVKAAIVRAHVDPQRLILELTETALLDDAARAGEALSELARYGIRTSIDDFGQGQTSLRYLSALPLAEIKIDRSFVMDVLSNTGHAAIVRSIIELGHNLGFEVVAEGIEDEVTRARLQEMGCDVGQGYHFARPMPIAQLVSLHQPVPRLAAAPSSSTRPA